MSTSKFEIPPQEPPKSSDDERAESEAASLAFDLDLESAETRQKISQIFEKQITEKLVNKIVRYFFIFASILVAISFAVLFYHYIAPDDWLFLGSERTQRLKEFLLSGTIGAVLAAIVRSKLMNRVDD